MSETDWHKALDPKDWLFDGRPIRGEAGLQMWNELDWNDSFVDVGPSPAGNLGPYWKVARPCEGTRHRLYPRFLNGKWAPLIRQAVIQFALQNIAKDDPS